jgi:imidazolonepropionase-like amidohydrolase
MQALLAGTSVAARHLGLMDMGMLAAGYSADLLVLSANPLDDIRNTRAIEAVYLQGRIVDRDALSRAWMVGD